MELTERVERLERQSRALRLAVALSFLVGVVLGAISWRSMESRLERADARVTELGHDAARVLRIVVVEADAAHARSGELSQEIDELRGVMEDSERTVEGQEFLLRDPSGRECGRLGRGADGSTELTLRDTDGKTRARMCVGVDGLPTISLMSEHGLTQALMYLDKDAEPRLSLTSAHGLGSISLGMGTEGTPSLMFSDANVLRGHLGVGADGATNLILSDGNGNMRLVVGTTVDGSPRLRLRAEDGGTIWAAPQK